MQIQVVTLFPELVTAVAASGVVARAAERGLFELGTWNPRDYTRDRTGRVDDRPFGGGPGMVMQVQPVRDTMRAATAAAPRGARRIYLSPQGRPLTQRALAEFAGEPGLVLLAGRYEGIDERVLEGEIDEEWSLGDYVLSGGELAAMVVIDGVVRLLAGALGDEQKPAQDTIADGLLEGPQYTRPERIDGREVPWVLRSGDHAAIARWRRQQALGRTWLRRPDLLSEDRLDSEDRRLLREFIEGYRARHHRVDQDL